MKPPTAPRVERPLVPLAVAFTLGVAVERLIGAGPTAWGLGALGLAAAAAAAGLIRVPRCAVAAAVALFACLGGLALAVGAHGRPAHHLSRLADGWLHSPVAVEGWVARPPDPPAAGAADTRDGDDPGPVRVVVEVLRLRLGDGWQPASGRARLTLYEQAPVVGYGDEIRGVFRLRHPRRFDNAGGFDYPAYLATQDIFLEGWTRQPVEVLPTGRGSPVLAAVFSLRRLLLERLDAAMPGERGALLKAVVLGDRSGLTPEMNQAFLDSGTYHIMAISGLNVSLLAGALFGLFRLGRVSPRVAAAAAALLVTLYSALAGGTASVVRAAVMADIYLLAVVLDRRADLLNTLALAVLALLWWTPGFLTEVGFQLTVLATLGIVLVVPRCETALSRVPRPVRWVLESGAITLAATLMTLPVLAGSFNRISPVGVAANVPIVPLAGLITALGTATCALLALSPVAAAWLVQLDGWLVELLLAMAGWFASCPLATLEVYTPTPPMYLAYYAGVAAALTAAAGRRRAVRVAGGAVTGGCAALLGVLTLVRLGGAGDVDGARLTMLDVGQGQAVFVEARGGRRALVDVGSLGGLDVGKHVVAPFLRHEWIGRLDLLVLTHAETDHMSGAPSILRSFEVGEVWSPSPLGPSPTGLWIEEYLRHRRIPHRIVRADMVPAALGEARLEVLFPPSGLPAAGREPQSLVLAVAAAGHTALLTADITARQGEGDLVQRGVTAEVLTVPHHGSRTSSSSGFLEAVRPRVALVSAGHRNRFQHPHPEVLSRYAALGARVLRTDLHGAIVVDMGPRGVRASARRGGE